jgi:hypothetical protein
VVVTTNRRGRAIRPAARFRDYFLCLFDSLYLIYNTTKIYYILILYGVVKLQNLLYGISSKSCISWVRVSGGEGRYQPVFEIGGSSISNTIEVLLHD